jgi:hypothetical protein
MQISVNEPSTVYIHFTNGTPQTFKLYRNGKLYYFRYLDGKVPRIKFNIPDVGNYTSETPFKVVKLAKIEVPDNLPKLPPAERDRIKPSIVKHNPDLKNTPARIFTDTGLIETGEIFPSLPEPIQKFLLWHEKGHFFYRSEHLCDLYALVNYLRQGYPRSMAYYALIKVLKRSKQNMQRVDEMMKQITNSTGSFDPGI